MYQIARLTAGSTEAALARWWRCSAVVDAGAPVPTDDLRSQMAEGTGLMATPAAAFLPDIP
jgi:hypothetical protein